MPKPIQEKQEWIPVKDLSELSVGMVIKLRTCCVNHSDSRHKVGPQIGILTKYLGMVIHKAASVPAPTYEWTGKRAGHIPNIIIFPQLNFDKENVFRLNTGLDNQELQEEGRKIYGKQTIKS